MEIGCKWSGLSPGKVESSQFIQECGALARYDGFMQPLIVLITIFLALIIPLGWWAALRFALAGMFLLTASAHWGERRPDLIRMVPPIFPRPDLMVTITGALEILGLIGLLIPALAAYAGVCLALLLVGLFPANVRAATHNLTIAGHRATPLPARAIIQVVFLIATLAVALR